MAGFKKPFSAYNLPWFIFDIFNLQLITTVTIPTGSINSSKSIVLSETPIPGLDFDPVNPGGFGNERVSLTLPLIKRNGTIGNLLLLKQFDNLRNSPTGVNLSNVFKKSNQFQPNPKVLYYWGSGNSIPLMYWVSKCDYSHDAKFINKNGYPEYTNVNLELLLDKTSKLNKAEDVFRKISSFAGAINNAFDIKRSNNLEGAF